MKAISLWQPWASLIACGEKRYEIRSWAPSRHLIGKRIAIHAAKKVDKSLGDWVTEIAYGQYGIDLADRLEATHSKTTEPSYGFFGEVVLPIGSVVCTAVLEAAFLLGSPAKGTARPAAEVVRTMSNRDFPPCFTVPYDDWGDYEQGRWAWLLSDISVINPPAPVRGKQGFFDLPQGWLVDDLVTAHG